MKMNNQYILSICVITYNRADVLKHCLDAIVYHDLAKTGTIEVVVCDNASTDGTEVLMQMYKEFEFVRYYRNDENMGVERNYIKSMDLANGLFLKPTNDYTVYTKEGLEKMYNTIKDNVQSQPLILFDNIPTCNLWEDDLNLDINAVIDQVGWSMSWMGINGFWRDEWHKIENKEPVVFLCIDHFFKILIEKKTANIYTGHFSDRYPFKQKQGGYNFFKVHTEDFLYFYKKYYKAGYITKETYDKLNKRLCSSLLYFLRKFLVKEKDKFVYELDDWFDYFVKAFWRYPWFYWKMAIWFLTIIKHYMLKPFKQVAKK